MKPVQPSGLPCSLAALLLAALPACGIDWVASDGDFGNPGNWSDGNLPTSGTPVNIANSGTATIELPGAYTIGPLILGNHAGDGSILHSGGVLTTGRMIIGGDDSSNGTGNGHYIITNGTLRSAVDDIWIGSKGGTGTLELSGNAFVSSAGWVVVGRDGASGHLKLSGTSTLEVKSGNLPVGCNSNGFTSTLDVEDSARIDAAGEIWVGWIGNNTNEGIMTMKDHASVSTRNGFVLGREGAKGAVDLSGQSTLNAGGYLVCGANPGGHGELILRDEAHVHANKQVWLGYLGGSGTITVEGGCLSAHASVADDPSGAGIAFHNNGALVLNGGQVSTPGFIKKTGTASLTFNGGTLRATGINTSGGFFANFANEELRIGHDGLLFDTKGFAVEVQQSLTGDGPLTKQGTGSLSLKGSIGHSGNTVVETGTLTLELPILSDSHSVSVSGPSSHLKLPHGQVDRIARLIIDGIVQPAGLYKAPGASGPGTETPVIEGSGSLEVRFGPGQVIFSEWIADHQPAYSFEEDSDGDGLKNGLEHVFGSDPNNFNPAPRMITLATGIAILEHPLAASLAADVSYSHEWSKDLIHWHRSDESDTDGTRVIITPITSGSGIQAQYQLVSGSAMQLFGRVVAHQLTTP
ncbi:thrombospondin type 3 repeat-containing protein [Luteolibacter luteus]|uniref:Uncharacterized protein n=1 Tax=Luteolibacter luteus TaxID=2728835 RepID=A0A858REZ7_9BACT|nr:thrombospondin type 3 repeat-containing protein [Luteolibacter luteus]QJE95118.1 hypothetical protein HHL09_04810 [Luteolibacter luteus]